LVRLLDATSGVQRRELKGHEGRINKGLFSPDGRLILTVSDDRTARLWESASEKQLRLFRGDGAIGDADFSSHGDLIATAEGGALRVWHVNDGQKAWELIFNKGSPPLSSIHFSPDGMLLAGGFSNVWGDINVWDVPTGRRVANLRTDGDAWGIAFSPNGKIIAATDGNGKLRLWNTSWMKLTDYQGKRQFGGSVPAFSSDGTLLAAGSLSETYVWPVFPFGQSLVDYARAIMPRKLTAERRRQFFLEQSGDIGIAIATDDELIRVKQTGTRSPAERAGLEINDAITRIDREEVDGLTQEEVVERLGGPVGSKVVLTILRKGHDKPMEVTVTRGEAQTQQSRM